MKTLKIGQGTVTINTEALAEGVHQMHAQEEDKKTMLAFGMLDAKIMEAVETELKAKVIKTIGEGNAEFFNDRVKQFLADVNKAIAVGVYKRAKMVV